MTTVGLFALLFAILAGYYVWVGTDNPGLGIAAFFALACIRFSLAATLQYYFELARGTPSSDLPLTENSGLPKEKENHEKES